MQSNSALTMMVAGLLTACAGNGAEESPHADASTDANPNACELDAPGPAWLAFASARAGNYDLFRVRSDGNCLTQITTYPLDDLAPAWRPGEHVLAFASDRDGALALYTHDLGADQATRIDVGDLLASAPAWSPDGAWLAFEGRVVGELGTSIYKLELDGGPPVRLTDNDAHDSGPTWSSDGSSIYYISDLSGSYEIHTVGSNGEGTRQLTSDSGILGKPALSADGTTLAYARSNAETSLPEVVLHSMSDGSERLLSDEPASEPSFSPTGTTIAVSSFRYGDPEILILDLATGDERLRLTNEPASDGAPAFAAPNH